MDCFIIPPKEKTSFYYFFIDSILTPHSFKNKNIFSSFPFINERLKKHLNHSFIIRKYVENVRKIGFKRL